MLEADVWTTHHPNLESLENKIIKKAASMLLEVIHTAISQWLEHLAKCTTVEGGILNKFKKFAKKALYPMPRVIAHYLIKKLCRTHPRAEVQ